jgi:hypothetical protein
MQCVNSVKALVKLLFESIIRATFSCRPYKFMATLYDIPEMNVSGYSFIRVRLEFFTRDIKLFVTYSMSFLLILTIKLKQIPNTETVGVKSEFILSCYLC